MVFVFGKVLTDLGFAQAGFAQVLLPGLVALTVMLTALQSTALPLVIEFSFTKEIEDRLLAPLPVSMVAVSGMGLLLGTAVAPNRINITFALVLTPLLFTGCVQYPWPSLTHLRWFQVVTLFNPITYASEGVRSAMLPLSPHMTTWKAAAALAAVTVALAAAGVAGFLRRALD